MSNGRKNKKYIEMFGSFTEPHCQIRRTDRLWKNDLNALSLLLYIPLVHKYEHPTPDCAYTHLSFL